MTPPQRRTQSPAGRTPSSVFRRPAGFVASRGDETILNFTVPNPVTLNIALFVVKGTSPGPLSDYLDAAAQRLQRYGFSLNIHPPSKVPIEIDYVGKIGPKFGIDDEDTEAAKARQKAADAFNDQANPLRFPIIMAPINQSDRGNEERGKTEVDLDNVSGEGRKTVNGVTWLPYAIVDSAKKDADSGALLHEMCHGALCRHPQDGPDQNNVASSDQSNIMRESDPKGPARVTLNKKQVRNLAKCYFATPRITI